MPVVPQLAHLAAMPRPHKAAHLPGITRYKQPQPMFPQKEHVFYNHTLRGSSQPQSSVGTMS
jgi:hypothetical protein